MKQHLAFVALAWTLFFCGGLFAQADAAVLQAIRVESKDAARAVLAELRAGRSLDELARGQASEGLRERAGYLGRVPEATLPSRMRQALSELKEGQNSQEIPLDEGYVIFRLLRPQEESGYTRSAASARYYVELGLIYGEMHYEDGEIEAYRGMSDHFAVPE